MLKITPRVSSPSPSFLGFRSNRESVYLPLTWMLPWFGLDKDVWTTTPVVSSHSGISLFNQQQRMMRFQPLHHSLCLLINFFFFPFLSLSVSVSISFSVSFSFCFSLSHSLSPYYVHSGRLTITCSPVHPQICCSDQLSSPLKSGPDTSRLWTEKAKRHTISSKEGKRTPKPKNTKIKRPV